MLIYLNKDEAILLKHKLEEASNPYINIIKQIDEGLKNYV